MIRQVSVSSGERGLLLLRVRDEIRMVMSSYQTLYESSIAFGMRKALLADQKKRELQAKVGVPCFTCLQLSLHPFFKLHPLLFHNPPPLPFFFIP